jgi:putative glutamine amidotransferase
LELMRGALARDLPVLAICRGSQVLNVALGGDLEQHVPDRVAADTHKQTPGVFADHDVEVLGGTRLASIVGDRTDVKSHHHQGYGELGEGLRESARAADGTVEALEDPTRRFTLGVLWHPEEGEDLALFKALVAEAAEYRKTRRA